MPRRRGRSDTTSRLGGSERTTRRRASVNASIHTTKNYPGTKLRETITISDNTTKPIIWLRDDNVGIGPFDPDLAESYWRWENEPRVRVGYGQQTPDSLEERKAAVASQLKNTMHSARFTIYDLSSGEPVPVGTTALMIDHRQRTAEFFILIGDDANRGRGIGTAATRLTLDYAFFVTNLRCVYLTVLAPNVAGIKAYEKAGFSHSGVRRQSGYWLGESADEVLMDAIPADFPGISAVKQQVNETR